MINLTYILRMLNGRCYGYGNQLSFGVNSTSGSAIAEGPRDVLVSRNSATTKYRYRVALFA